MKRLSVAVLFFVLLPILQLAAQEGKMVEVNGIRMYFEIHGSGKPLLLVHGNGSSSADMKNQTEYFKKSRMVIVADSRGHGRSSTGKAGFNYDLLASDWAALLEKLDLRDVDVFGWSDGAIIGILLAKDHGNRINKVYAFGANVKPAKESLQPQLVRGIEQATSRMPANATERSIMEMMLYYPDIIWDELGKINRPVMVATADHDLVLLEHSLKIYQSLPKACFEVFSSANHFLPMLDPERINKSAESFFARPFEKIPFIIPGMELLWVE